MKPYREIEFTTTRSRNGLTAGKTCYQGHLKHNAVLSERETRKAFAAELRSCEATFADVSRRHASA